MKSSFVKMLDSMLKRREKLKNLMEPKLKSMLKELKLLEISSRNWDLSLLVMHLELPIELTAVLSASTTNIELQVYLCKSS